ncbi:unnamed protein product [Gongylonema pulchrum]|uniref:SH3-binding, glutamic acid-rich protein n=1 Tax=Gongylonema pulchrum TaxID=637853 RepID=A0A183EWE6_9BILA|nr:unnamed protein product [Gongylonema pulchrum]
MLQKLLRVHTNVLVLFVDSLADKSNELRRISKVVVAAAKQAQGQATVAQIPCNDGVARKLCKKLKVNPKPFVFKHYRDGEFHKDYDRQMNAKSMYRFLLDPAGDIPWDEDPSATNVVHLGNFGFNITGLC